MRFTSPEPRVSMPDDDLEKLLGGFAADTLTPEEKQRLYHTALHDQQLFNLFADEQALKELLTDPVVREKLLQSLRETTSTTDGGNVSWFGWFRRPAGLAWAGGLTAALFALVLGTNIYQESLKEAARSVADEEVVAPTPPDSAPSAEKPATPGITGSRKETPENTKSTAPTGKQALTANTSKPATSTMAKAKEERATLQNGADASRERPPSTPQSFPRLEEQASSSADQDHASVPLTSASRVAPANAPTTDTRTTQVGSALSARSLFYGESREVVSSAVKEKQEGSYSVQQFDRPTHKGERGADLTETRAETARPLGIRYSLVMNGMKDLHDDRDGETSLRTGSFDLMIEANQDSFFQVWGEAGSLPPHLLFPFSAGDPVSSRLLAHQRRRIPILAGHRSITVRLSLIPFDTPSTIGSDVMTPSPREHLQESSASLEASNSQEQATYVVTRDPSASTLTVRIPLH
ncbi:MAG: hypothetical protein CV089_23340 [Nitrospira sp. WS110]|nr:hypothetical protein [Nitrospira sp. WS110]